MSKCAVIVSRNDNYGGHLIDRATKCIENLLNTFDKVVYVDWKPVNGKTLIDNLPDHIQLNSNLVTIAVTEDYINLNYPEVKLFPIVEVLGRNIGIRKAIDLNCEWVCSTNIDIIMNNFDESILDTDTLYTARRYNIPMDQHLRFPNSVDLLMFANNNKNQLKQMPLAVIDGVGVWDKGDNWSLVVCCGDFQLAHRDLWIEIRGFEEGMVGRSYADSNLMKKPILLGKKTAIHDCCIYHMDHGNESIKIPGEIKLPANDRIKWVNNFTMTSNTDKWGIYE